MTIYENLLIETDEKGLTVIEKPLRGKLKGLYCDNVIAVSSNIHNTSGKACVLAEEMGHYCTSCGNIINQELTENRKQELRARVWSYERLVALCDIVRAYEAGCRTRYEVAEFLEVTEEFLSETVNHYKTKHGQYALIDNYVIFLEPSIGILKILYDDITYDA